MSHELSRQRRRRIVQTVALVAGMVVLAARAAALVVGPVAGWAAVLTFSAIALNAALNQRLRLPAGSRRIEWYDAPDIHRLVAELARDAGLEAAPPLYLVPSRTPVALTTGLGPNAMIVVSRGLLDTLSLRELRAVLAHEVAHIRNRDLPLFAVISAMQQVTRIVGLVLTAFVFLAFPMLLLGVALLPSQALLYLVLVPIVSMLVQMAILRTREFQADLGAVELTDDPEALSSALVRLDRLQRGQWSMTLMGGSARSPLGELLRTHPTTEERVAELERLAPTVRAAARRA